MADSLIGLISVSPKRPRPGESVHVEVLDPEGKPLASRRNTRVFIGGVLGSSQKMQFKTAGERKIHVRVARGKVSESRTHAIEVAGKPVLVPGPIKGGPRPIVRTAMLNASHAYGDPYRVSFSVGAAGSSPKSVIGKHVVLDSGLKSSSVKAIVGTLAAGGPKVGAVASAISALPGARVEAVSRGKLTAGKNGARSLTAVVMDLGGADPSAAFATTPVAKPLVYHWDFGDGTSANTILPLAFHDYTASLEHDKPTQAFHVACKMPNGTLLERTLTVHSAYAISRSQGYIVPPVTFNMLASRSWVPFGGGGSFGMQAVVANPESQVITITHQAVVAHDEGDVTGDANHIPVFRKLATALAIPAGKTAALGVLVPSTVHSSGNTVSWSATGFTVYLAGTAASGAAVRLTLPCEIPIDLRGPPSGDHGLPQLPVLVTKLWPWDLVTNAITQVVTNPGDPLHNMLDPAKIVVDPAAGFYGIPGNVAVGDRRAAARFGALADAVMSVALNPVGGTGVAAALAGQPASAADRALGSAAVRSGAAALLTSRTIAPKGTALAMQGARATRQVRMAGGAAAAPPPPVPGSQAVALGNICDPTDIPDADAKAADAAQLACQLSDETAKYTVSAQFANARKGDIILSPGGPGLIANLLRMVDPPQRWSHSGIMTRNFDEITHSTASESRLKDHMNGASGFETNAVRYLWPGAVTQTVEHAINGETWLEPGTGKEYTISSFTEHPIGSPGASGFEIVPPVVVKPDPFKEGPDTRVTLHAVADHASGLAGRVDDKGKLIKPLGTHYRLFSYTDPTIALRKDPLEGNGWEKGTIPTVCSSFIWLCAKSQGVHLETKTTIPLNSDLEPEDVAQGAMVLPSGTDGLYGYTAEERQGAAEWLFETVHEQVQDKAGWLGEILSDAADTYANQLCNTFAMDDASASNADDRWRSTPAASAVSPDNILFWDSPDHAGIWGYVEPAIYREPRVEEYTVSRWAKVLKRGDISGLITLAGVPCAGAGVEVYDGKGALTGVDGRYAISDVPLGRYTIRAQKLGDDGILYRAQREIDIETASLAVDLKLAPPADRFRLLKVDVQFHGNDDETIGSEPDDEGPFHYELELGPDRIQNSRGVGSFHWGGELSCDFSLTASLLSDDSILVSVYGELWEGTGETHDDEHFAGSKTTTMVVAKDGSQSMILYVSNTTNDTPDSGTLTIAVSNQRNVV